MLFRTLSILALSCLAAVAYAEPLTFEAALKLAESLSPDLDAQTHAVEAARLSARAAGALPDPRVELAIENLPATGPDQWRLNRDFMTMRRIGVMQDIPNSAKRHATTAAAAALVGQVEAQRRLRVATVRTTAAVAWIERLYAERRSALFEELRRENGLFADQVQAQLAGGRGAAADLVVPKEEAADLADRLDAAQAEVAKARAGLRRFLGPAGDEPLSGEAPSLAIDAELLRSHVHTHPELALYGPMLEAAHAQVHEAEASRIPDLSVGLSYARRAAQYSDMVTLQFSLTLPVFAATRQNPIIEARRQELRRLESERTEMLRDHTQALEWELADYEVLSRQLMRVREVRLPLAHQKLDLRMSAYGANKSDLTAVLGARRELIDIRLAEIDLQSQRDVAAARIYFAFVEPTP